MRQAKRPRPPFTGAAPVAGAAAATVPQARFVPAALLEAVMPSAPALGATISAWQAYERNLETLHRRFDRQARTVQELSLAQARRQQEISALRLEVQSLKELVETLQKQTKADKKATQAQFKTLKAEMLDQLHTELTPIQAQVRSLTGELAAVRTDFKTQQQSISALDKKLIAFKAELQLLDRTQTQLDEEVAATIRELPAQVKKLIKQLETKVTQLDRELRGRIASAILPPEMDRLHESVAGSAAALQEIKAVQASDAQKLAALEVEMTTVTTKYQKQLQELTNALRQYKEQVDVWVTGQLQTALGAFRAEVRQMQLILQRDATAAVRVTLSTAREMCDQSQDACRASIEKIRAQLPSLTEAVIAYQEELTRLRAEVAELTARVESSASRVDAMRMGEQPLAKLDEETRASSVVSALLAGLGDDVADSRGWTPTLFGNGMGDSGERELLEAAVRRLG